MGRYTEKHIQHNYHIKDILCAYYTAIVNTDSLPASQSCWLHYIFVLIQFTVHINNIIMWTVNMP